MTEPQYSDSTMDALAERARRAQELRSRIGREELIPRDIELNGRQVSLYEQMALDPDNFEAASICWLLGDIVVLAGDQWISVVDNMPVKKEWVDRWGRVLRHDPTVTPGDIYDVEAIHSPGSA